MKRDFPFWFTVGMIAFWLLSFALIAWRNGLS